MSLPEDPPAKTNDMLFVHSPSEGGEGFKVVRMREDAIEVGEIREAAEGRPIHGEVVKLKPRPEHRQLFDVEVLVPGPRTGPSELSAPRSGPAQVATDAYRENWLAIFGARARSSDDEPN